MAIFWFILAAIFVVMYLFNGHVPTSVQTKTTVNIVAIIGVIVLAIAASTNLF